jgi:hypothetical protein
MWRSRPFSDKCLDNRLPGRQSRRKTSLPLHPPPPPRHTCRNAKLPPMEGHRRAEPSHSKPTAAPFPPTAKETGRQPLSAHPMSQRAADTSASGSTATMHCQGPALRRRFFGQRRTADEPAMEFSYRPVGRERPRERRIREIAPVPFPRSRSPACQLAPTGATAANGQGGTSDATEPQPRPCLLRGASANPHRQEAGTGIQPPRPRPAKENSGVPTNNGPRHRFVFSSTPTWQGYRNLGGITSSTTLITSNPSTDKTNGYKIVNYGHLKCANSTLPPAPPPPPPLG